MSLLQNYGITLRLAWGGRRFKDKREMDSGQGTLDKSGNSSEAHHALEISGILL